MDHFGDGLNCRSQRGTSGRRVQPIMTSNRPEVAASMAVREMKLRRFSDVFVFME
jgi:hypothetical protein